MEKPCRTPGDADQNASVTRETAEPPRWGSEPLVTIDGATFVLQPVEDLTKTMPPERVEQFIKNYKAAENPTNRYNEEQAMDRFRQRRVGRRHG